MNLYTNFGCFRYFLVPYEQMSVFQLQVKDRKSLIEDLIDSNETSLKLEDNPYGGKFKLYLVSKINSDNYLLKFGKLTKIKYNQDTGNDFEESMIDDHPFIHIFINTKEQIILFERKTKVFREYTYSASAFSKYLSERVDNYGYEFKYEEITSPDKFWNLIDSAESIESISLTIYSPNLFDGNTPAETAAKEFEDVTNSTENILTFKNKHGKLRPIKNKLESFIDYISGGGGNWKVKAKVPKKKLGTFSSKNITKIISLPEDIVNRSNQAILDIILPIISSIDRRPGDDKVNEVNKKDKIDE